MRRTASLLAAMTVPVAGTLAADSNPATTAAQPTAAAVEIALAPAGARDPVPAHPATAPPVGARPQHGRVLSDGERPQKMLLLMLMRAAAADPAEAMLRAGD
jgi:hypothetical protein